MLKKMLSLLLALCFAFSIGIAEEQKQTLIEAEEGVTTALQIRSLESDRAVGILGVESDPQQRRWKDFSDVFTSFVKKNWNVDVVFSDALWSNGWIWDL